MPVITRLVAGISALGGAGLYCYGLKEKEKKQVHASWTSNFTPSVKWDSNWDRRDPTSLVKPSLENNEKKHQENLEKKTASATRNIFLIRHGQYDLSGKSDEEHVLTSLGKRQADLTGKRLKELGFPYSRIVCSTMVRATQTGNIIQDHLPDVDFDRCPLLREGAPIPPEPPVGFWKPEIHQFFEDGARIEAAFRRYFHRADAKQEKDSYEIIVCHANVIRYFVCRALQFPPEAWLRLSLHHASITWLIIRPNGRVTLKALGDTGHMPPDMITAS